MKKTKIILEIFDEETFDFVKKFKKDAYIKCHVPRQII